MGSGVSVNYRIFAAENKSIVNMRKKICSLLLILILLLNSPILTIISAATENTNNTDEKINMELNKNS